jgi:hypothetical protein
MIRAYYVSCRVVWAYTHHQYRVVWCCSVSRNVRNCTDKVVSTHNIVDRCLYRFPRACLYKTMMRDTHPTYYQRPSVCLSIGGREKWAGWNVAITSFGPALGIRHSMCRGVCCKLAVRYILYVSGQLGVLSFLAFHWTTLEMFYYNSWNNMPLFTHSQVSRPLDSLH